MIVAVPTHAPEIAALAADHGAEQLTAQQVVETMVERFGSRVLVMAQGRLAAEGDYHAIRELMDDRPHRIRIRSDDPRSLAAGLLGGAGVVGVTLDGADATIVDTRDAALLRRSVAVVARDRNVRLNEVTPLDDDLESVFRYLVEGR